MNLLESGLLWAFNIHFTGFQTSGICVARLSLMCKRITYQSHYCLMQPREPPARPAWVIRNQCSQYVTECRMIDVILTVGKQDICNEAFPYQEKIILRETIKGYLRWATAIHILHYTFYNFYSCNKLRDPWCYLIHIAILWSYFLDFSSKLALQYVYCHDTSHFTTERMSKLRKYFVC